MSGAKELQALQAHSEEKMRKHSSWKRRFTFFANHAFVLLTTVGVIVGFAIGFGVRKLDPSPMTIQWLGVPGDIFIRLLKLTILPIIAGNVIIVASKLNPRTNGKVSLVSFAFIITANIISPSIGVSFGTMFKPGKSSMNSNSSQEENSVKSLSKVSTSDVLYDLAMNMFPDNVVSVAVFQTQTQYKSDLSQAVMTLLTVMNSSMHKNSSEPLSNHNRDLLQKVNLMQERQISQSHSVNMIGVLFIACTFGVAARFAGEKGRAFVAFFEAMTEVVAIVIRAFIWLTPIGACFMIATSIAAVDNIIETFFRLGVFIITVISGLLFHFILLNLALFVVSRRNPLGVLKPAFRSWFISFATTAPVVAVPELYEACDRYGISNRVSRFVIPFAASLKGDGSAVYVTTAVVFIAQLSGVSINAGSAAIIIFQSATAALALPNIPSAAIVISVTILQSLGIPVNNVALLFATEWLLDRIRSGNISLSHLYCAAFTHYLCKSDVTEEETFDGKPRVYDIESTGEEEMERTNSSHSAMA